MERISYQWNEQIYELDIAKLNYFYVDEQVLMDEIKLEQILDLLKGKTLMVDKEYYDQGCEVCGFKKAEEEKYYAFLESHFYLFVKEEKLVGHSLAGDYESLSFRQLEKQGKVDQLYMVSLVICMHCQSYSIEIEACD